MTTNELFQNIDGPQLKQQRQILSKIIDDGYIPTTDELDLLEGLRTFLDEVADIAYEDFGKDTLFLGTDLFRNLYRCACGEEWEDTHSCRCNDKCPVCHKEIQPYQSQEVAGDF